MSLFARTSVADRFRRALAAGGAALVLALSVFAASPTAHAWLHTASPECPGHAHDSDPGHADDNDAGCAVVLFASGVSLPVGPAALHPPQLVAEGVTPVTAADVFLVSPRYLRQPERGPPGRV